jgi:tetratricopeptide (TPR) repeat protein
MQRSSARNRSSIPSALLIFPLATLLLAACAGPSGIAPRLGLISDTSIVARRAAEKEVEESRRTIEAGRASDAIPRLLYVVSVYPDAPSAVEARYWLGVAYNELNGFQDAVEFFQEYLRLAPDGPRAAEATEKLKEISERYAANFDTPGELDREIAQASASIQENPNNVQARMQLADALWRRGDYADAAKLYADIGKEHPEYARDPVLCGRVELLPDGEYIVLTPAEVQRRQEQANPIVVINTASFRAGRDRWTQVPQFYVVTGQVLNQGDRALYGVAVYVTLYGFGNVVFDTSTVHIGRLNPGELRAFSVRFSNFENIESIDRYECVATFER